MKTIKVNEISVKSKDFDLTKEQAEEIIKYSNENKQEKEDIDSITVSACEDKGMDLDIEYVQPHEIERIRRITGYISTTLDRFNDAKKAEVRDRVKHS